MLIALVTWSGLPELSVDDRILAAVLRERGMTVTAAVWDDPRIDWSSFDAVVIRSTWDYHKRYGEFRDWLDTLERVGARVWNPVPVLRWSSDKTYLRDLDVPRVPTAFVPRGGDVGEAMRANGWLRAVVKPAISASAFGTRVVTEGAIADRDVLVQPFIEEVVRDGEWSLIFFAGRFSHSVLKRAKAGDFRVQTDFGGSVERRDTAPALIAQAQRVIDAAPATLYARVDGVLIDGVFTLMELELVEPHLFFAESPAAAERFAAALASRPGRS
jgi:glutathione synthase/RimK-type ligase-like ATP-grasp enzyme